MSSSEFFFDPLNDAELDELMEFSHLEVAEYGHVILKQGDLDGGHAYLIIVGQVKIERMDGSPQLVTELGPGQIFGEFSFFSHTTRSASVIANKYTEFLKINLSDIDEMFEAYPRTAFNLLKYIAKEASLKLSHRATSSRSS
ncbi:MAG: cyclic nucleotide-binding domain-containing protein [Planctomycetes bacterium]|nr:cyclic nucleotide-binding domain-containing protein [Planctomycetota bacterium]